MDGIGYVERGQAHFKYPQFSVILELTHTFEISRKVT